MPPWNVSRDPVPDASSPADLGERRLISYDELGRFYRSDSVKSRVEQLDYDPWDGARTALCLLALLALMGLGALACRVRDRLMIRRHRRLMLRRQQSARTEEAVCSGRARLSELTLPLRLATADPALEDGHGGGGEARGVRLSTGDAESSSRSESCCKEAAHGINIPEVTDPIPEGLALREPARDQQSASCVARAVD